MLIYNVTINIDESVHDQWLDWMKDKHLPDMLATGKFSHAKMSTPLNPNKDQSAASKEPVFDPGIIPRR